MKLHHFQEGYSYMSDVNPQPEQSVVDKFSGVSDKLRSYYIGLWAKEQGIKSDDAMFKAGYIKDGYIGQGAWNWRYVGMGESIQEGEERSIIQDAVVDHLIETFGGQNWMIFADTREQLEAKMYDEIETLSVEEVVDPNMEVGGQPIGNFASGRVIDVIDSSSAIESAMQHVEGLDEGKSPHKKGSAKYKKHMAAMHAEDVTTLNTEPKLGKLPHEEVESVIHQWVNQEDHIELSNGMHVLSGENHGHADNVALIVDADYKILDHDDDIVELMQQFTSQEIDPSIVETMHAEDVNNSGMIGKPDSYYDEEDRKQAYNELQDALDQHPSWAHDSIKDGICPDCAGNSCMDGDYENGEDSCDGSGNYGCDEGEMSFGNGECSWVEITKHDERQAEKANRGPAPSKEQIMKLLPRLHDEYVKSGRYNAFELPSILRQMYPELNKRVAGSYVADFFKTFEEDIDEVAGAKDCWDGYKKDGTQPGTGKNKGKRVNKCVKEENLDESSDEVMVAKMLAKALGDPNRWTEMSAPELYAELESTNPEVADMISKVARMLYDVKLQERAYKDVGVADTVKDQRGKEFQFDKGSKKFKSQDGEEADVKTKLGKDLMRLRKNHMKRTSPSYPNKHSK